ncbi:MAG: CBS domain-containing protein [Burkholderiales bacterium]
MRTIGEICQREVTIGTLDMTVGAAAKLMRHRHVGSVVIVDRANGEIGAPIGIVTDRNIVIEVTAADLNANALTVGDIMCRDLVTAGEDEGVLEAMQIMRYKGVRRLPVVGENGKLVGIIAIDDLIEVLADQLGELSKIFAREQAREAAARR